MLVGRHEALALHADHPPFGGQDLGDVVPVAVELGKHSKRFGKPLTPERAGAAVVELVRADAPSVAPAYLLSGDGLQKLS